MKESNDPSCLGTNGGDGSNGGNGDGDGSDGNGNNVPLDIKKIQIDGWLRVASDAFLDKARFPNVPIHKCKEKGAFDILQYAMEQGGQKMEYSIGNLQYGSLPEVNYVDKFFVRLQHRTVWFTEQNTTSIVVASIDITKFKDSSTLNSPGCFQVSNNQDEWFLCADTQEEANHWLCEINESLGGPKCDRSKVDSVTVQPVETEIQPLIIVPLPSPDCAKDWNYNLHGEDWKCTCNTGREQSPLNLPNPYMGELIKYNAQFQYFDVSPSLIDVVYEQNMIRFKILGPNRNSFGQITDIDGTVYNATEIQIHTPAEHQILNQSYDMEVQVIHQAISGVMRQQAVLSFLFDYRPGGLNRAVSNWNLINMPNPKTKQVQKFFQNDFNVMQFLYNDPLPETPQFNYYKYMGSLTAPPCEEYVVWFVYQNPLYLGSTALDMIREALFIPGRTAADRDDNFDGSNRIVQKMVDRKIFFYDKKKDCQNPYTEEKDETGHWEKQMKKVDKFFYVDGERPSGIADAFVVSQEEAEIGSNNTPRKTDRYQLENPN